MPVLSSAVTVKVTVPPAVTLVALRLVMANWVAGTAGMTVMVGRVEVMAWPLRVAVMVNVLAAEAVVPVKVAV